MARKWLPDYRWWNLPEMASWSSNSEKFISCSVRKKVCGGQAPGLLGHLWGTGPVSKQEKGRIAWGGGGWGRGTWSRENSSLHSCFSLRFREIAGSLEAALTDVLEDAPGNILTVTKAIIKWIDSIHQVFLVAWAPWEHFELLLSSSSVTCSVVSNSLQPHGL